MRNRPQVLVICKNQIDYNYQVLVIEKKTVNIIRTLYIFIVVNICFTKKKKKKKKKWKTYTKPKKKKKKKRGNWNTYTKPKKTKQVKICR